MLSENGGNARQSDRATQEHWQMPVRLIVAEGGVALGVFRDTSVRWIQRGSMVKLLQGRSRDVWVGIAYALAVALCGAVLNVVTFYDPSTPVVLDVWAIGFWLLLYVPILIWPPMFGWRLKEIGFGLNPWTLVASLLLIGTCGAFVRLKPGFALTDAAVEAFARTGEELFFRGFVYTLILRLSAGRKRPWLWAVAGSAIAFMSVHTTAFRPEYVASMGDRPAWWIILERLQNVLLLGLVFGLIRAGTQSIWPSVLAHSLSGGGLLALPVTVVLLSAGWFWGKLRGEPMLDWISSERLNTY